MYQYRCSVVKDYRFCVSYAAYVLADRCIREVSHVWARLNPEIQKKSFTPEEDAILLEQTSQTSTICWSTIASNHLPDRSGAQCRQRYHQLIKSQSTSKNPKQINRKVGQIIHSPTLPSITISYLTRNNQFIELQNRS